MRLDIYEPTLPSDAMPQQRSWMFPADPTQEDHTRQEETKVDIMRINVIQLNRNRKQTAGLSNSTYRFYLYNSDSVCGDKTEALLASYRASSFIFMAPLYEFSVSSPIKPLYTTCPAANSRHSVAKEPDGCKYWIYNYQVDTNLNLLSSRMHE